MYFKKRVLHLPKITIMNIKINTTTKSGVTKVNAIGYFKSDFFCLNTLIARQTEIWALINKLPKNSEASKKASSLYNVTELMRVQLLRAM